MTMETVYTIGQIIAIICILLMVIAFSRELYFAYAKKDKQKNKKCENIGKRDNKNLRNNKHNVKEEKYYHIYRHRHNVKKEKYYHIYRHR